MLLKQERKQQKLLEGINNDVPLSLTGDPFRKGQIHINLISNAVKFTEKGEIIVRITLDSKKTDVDDNPALVSLLVSVKDSGIGIKTDLIKYEYKLCLKQLQ